MRCAGGSPTICSSLCCHHLWKEPVNAIHCGAKCDILYACAQYTHIHTYFHIDKHIHTFTRFTQFHIYTWQGRSRTHHMSAESGWNWKWSDGVGKVKCAFSRTTFTFFSSSTLLNQQSTFHLQCLLKTYFSTQLSFSQPDILLPDRGSVQPTPQPQHFVKCLLILRPPKRE